MANTPIAHFRQRSLSQPIFSRELHQTHGDVIQDKSAAGGERSASGQPAHSRIPVRADEVSTEVSRSQKQHAHRRGLVPLTIHVECSVRDEVERRAENSGGKKPLSLSEVGRPIFKRGLQADIDMQYGALIAPAVRETVKEETQSIREEIRSLRKFVALCFARIGFDTGQTRAIATNILARQSGMTQDTCTKILDKSAETAKKNLTRQTPQISDLLDVFDQWVTNEDAVHPMSHE
jgi:hypothetical protein